MTDDQCQLPRARGTRPRAVLSWPCGRYGRMATLFQPWSLWLDGYLGYPCNGETMGRLRGACPEDRSSRRFGLVMAGTLGRSACQPLARTQPKGRWTPTKTGVH
jgi:hypothetical protein